MTPMGVRTRGLDIKVGAKQRAADKAMHAEAQAVVDRWNQPRAATSVADDTGSADRGHRGSSRSLGSRHQATVPRYFFAGARACADAPVRQLAFGKTNVRSSISWVGISFMSIER
jgi:hypothetical protein